VVSLSADFNLEVMSPCLNVYRNVFDAKNFIEVIERHSRAEWPRLSWERSAEDRQDTRATYVSDYRSSLGMSLAPIWEGEVTAEDLVEVRTELDSVFSGVDKCIWDYRNSYDLYLSKDEPMSVLKYTVGTEYRTHWDSGPQNGRVLSLICYLNDDYEGGEINFPRFNISYKPAANELLIFPSNYIYNHSVSEVTSGTRYSVVSWLT
jgi:hypothetical protein